MTLDDELKNLEEELRAYHAMEPSQQLRQRIADGVALSRKRARLRRWLWFGSAASIAAAAAMLVSGFFADDLPGPDRGSLERLSRVHTTTAWSYTIAAHRSDAELLRLLDSQAASRRRPGAVTSSSLAVALNQTTPTER